MGIRRVCVAIAVSPIFSILFFSSSPTNRLREEIRKEKNEKMEEVEKGNKEEKPTCRVIMHRWMLASIDLVVDLFRDGLSTSLLSLSLFFYSFAPQFFYSLFQSFVEKKTTLYV